MPSLSASYDIPKRGTNDDFNDTFRVTATGPVGLTYTCADAWGAYSGTFQTPLTQQESIFTRNYAPNVAGEYVYFIPGYAADANASLAAFVARRFATTGTQIVSGGPQGQSDAWQSYGLHSNSTTTWSVGPAKVRSGSSLGLTVVAFLDGATTRYKFAAGASTTNTSIINAWNAFILVTLGVMPTSASDPLFYTDLYWWGMTTTPLLGCREPGTTNPGSAFIAPYIDAIKRKWGSEYGV